MAKDVLDVGFLALSLLYGSEMCDVTAARSKISLNPVMRFLSDDCRSLMLEMLEEDPFKRVTAKDALKHSWFSIDFRSHSSPF